MNGTGGRYNNARSQCISTVHRLLHYSIVCDYQYHKWTKPIIFNLRILPQLVISSSIY